MSKRLLKKKNRKILGTAERPRLVVNKSNKNIYCQLIDDDKGITLAAASSQKDEKTVSCEIAIKVGEDIGKKAVALKIKKVVFDRNQYIYHGRTKALADGARKAGLEF